ncbi:MAG: type II toxin-antitoxin system prevent-host-death family antitoxin [Spirochaetales bacterium]|nr:type II toxin-antitoxin system prevent-host-death family antitoxin [Spirochaetales bacterium]
MEITLKQLRVQPGRIIAQAGSGQEITVTYRGKPRAKIVPLAGEKADTVDELFGIWKRRDELADVERYVRTIRKRRKLCS